MNKIRYDMKLMRYISLFESFTMVNVKDCIDTEPVTFIVGENRIAKAIGKNGSNVKRLERLFNRKIKIVEFNPDVLKFIENLIYPLKADKVSSKDKNIVINKKDSTTKALLIGRKSRNLKTLLQIVRRYFDIDNIRVI